MSLTIGFTCERCGRRLGASVDRNTREDLGFYIEPCTSCEDSAVEEARQKAHSEGYDDGYSEGYESGLRHEHGG